MIEEEDESDTDSEDITEAEKKFKQLARDEDVVRKMQEDWEAEEELKKGREEKCNTIEQRAKFLHDTIVAQRIFLAQQRSEAIKNKPPSRNQLRNQMMTYLKHVGGKKHSDLKTKGFEEIKALYDKIKRQRRYFSTLMAVLSILDRDDICAIYQLVMNRYQDETPKGFDKILGSILIIKVQSKVEMKDSTIALELIRFVKKQITELEPEDSDRDEKDL
ncbi:hypothetical protein Tco_0526666 [Tanacetum coccineum]